MNKNSAKIEILAKNRNSGQKSKFWAKIEILGKNRNSGQKSKFWTKIEILAKNRNSGQKSKFWPKIEILAKNLNSGQKSKFWPKIETFGNFTVRITLFHQFKFSITQVSNILKLWKKNKITKLGRKLYVYRQNSDKKSDTIISYKNCIFSPENSNI